jgi:hypothetical protein
MALIRWELGKLDDLDVLANSDVAGVEGGEEHKLVLPVLPGVADDAVQRDPSVHRVHEHVKLVQNPLKNNNLS